MEAGKMDAVPSIKPELERVIHEALKKYAADPVSAARIAVLDRISLEGKKVLVLAAGLGDVSRAARERGAALVDGLERDPDLVTLARLLNAYHRVTRVSFYHHDVSLPATYSEHYDVVLAFSAIPMVDPELGRIAEITDGALVTDAPPLGSSDESRDLLDSIQKRFPFHEALDVHAQASRLTDQRTFLLWAKSEAALRDALRGPATRGAPASDPYPSQDGDRSPDRGTS
jgi:predicted RNA methylase